MARKPPTKTAGRKSATAPAQQEVDLHLTFGARLLSEKQAAAVTPKGAAGQAEGAAGVQASRTNETYLAPSFRRGRIWA